MVVKNFSSWIKLIAVIGAIVVTGACGTPVSPPDTDPPLPAPEISAEFLSLRQLIQFHMPRLKAEFARIETLEADNDALLVLAQERLEKDRALLKVQEKRIGELQQSPNAGSPGEADSLRKSLQDLDEDIGRREKLKPQDLAADQLELEKANSRHLVTKFSDDLRELKKTNSNRDIALLADVVENLSKSSSGNRGILAGSLAVLKALEGGEEIRVKFGSSGFGIPDSSESATSGFVDLKQALVGIWNNHPEYILAIDGHADSRKFKNMNACDSAAANYWLARDRAVVVGKYFADALGSSQRIRIDWYGNFFRRHIEAVDENSKLGEDRRSEVRLLRIAEADRSAEVENVATQSPPTQSVAYSQIAHAGVFFGGRSFLHRDGKWVEGSCDVLSPPGKRILHMSPEFRRMQNELPTEDFSGLRVWNDDEMRASFVDYEVSIGNSFVVQTSKGCVEIFPCSDKRTRTRPEGQDR